MSDDPNAPRRPETNLDPEGTQGQSLGGFGHEREPTEPTHFETLLWHHLQRNDQTLGKDPDRSVMRELQENARRDFDVAIARATLEMPVTLTQDARWEDFASMADWSHSFRMHLAEEIRGDSVIQGMVDGGGYHLNIDAMFYNPDADEDPILNPWEFTGRILQAVPEVVAEQEESLGLVRPRADRAVRGAYASTRRGARARIERDRRIEEGGHGRGGQSTGASEAGGEGLEQTLPTRFDNDLLEEMRPYLPDTIASEQPVARQELRDMLETIPQPDRQRVIDRTILSRGEDYLHYDQQNTPTQTIDAFPETLDELEAVSWWSSDFREALREGLLLRVPEHELEAIGYRLDRSEYPPFIQTVADDRRVNPWQVVRRLRRALPSASGLASEDEGTFTFERLDDMVDQAFRTTLHNADRRTYGAPRVDDRNEEPEPEHLPGAWRSTGTMTGNIAGTLDEEPEGQLYWTRGILNRTRVPMDAAHARQLGRIGRFVGFLHGVRYQYREPEEANPPGNGWESLPRREGRFTSRRRRVPRDRSEEQPALDSSDATGSGDERSEAEAIPGWRMVDPEAPDAGRRRRPRRIPPPSDEI